MKALSMILLLCATVLHAQISLDTTVRLIGPEEQRQIEGLSPPQSVSAAMNAEAVVIGQVLWVQVGINGDTLEIDFDPVIEQVSDGLLARMMIPTELHGDLHIRVGDTLVFPLRLPDGTMPAAGQLRSGAIAEILFHDGTFLLLHPPRRSCPASTIPLSGATCVDVQDYPGVNFYQASERCVARGGRLCAWDEWVAACYLLGDELQNLFGNWEWINDTSDHTHTADQTGLVSCLSQHSITPLTTQGAARCCYTLR